MSLMTKRFVLWFSGIVLSFGLGLFLDHRLKTLAFPIWVKALALFLIFFAVLLLARSGRLLRKLGEPKEQWGWTTRLVTSDLYACLRHPHHLGIGLFVSSLSVVVGGVWTFLLASLFIWPAILWFLKSVEEKELVEKFNGEYLSYKEKTPMLLPSPGCLLKVLLGKAGKGN